MKISCKILQNMPLIVGRLTGFKGWLVALLLGIAASFAMPPYDGLAILFFTGIVFLWLLFAAQSKKQAFMLGFSFGFGFFAMGLVWVNNAVLLFAPQLSFLVPLIFIGFGIWGGSFVAIAALTSFYCKENKWSFVLSFAAMVMITEWVRAWLWTGFPWNLTALVWDKSDYVMQAVALFGAYGLGLFTWLLIGAFALIPFAKKKADMFAIIAVVVAILGGLYGDGFMRLENAEKVFKEDVVLRLVQPNVKATLGWDRKVAEQNFLDLIALSKEGLRESGATHIIWGETAAPFPLYEGSSALAKIMRELPDDITFISGTIRKDDKGVYNSAAIVNTDGKVVGFYDKSHLVPFGEYVPLRGILPLEKFTQGMGDFKSGKGPQAINVPFAGKVGILICYEVIFPAEIKGAGVAPDWFLNLTYDGWYGVSAGPYQHFATARMRAIEEGIPLVRVAATGISGVIDPYGEVVAILPLDTRGVLDAKLPMAINGGTLYGDFGNIIPLSLACLALLISLFLCKIKRR